MYQYKYTDRAFIKIIDDENSLLHKNYRNNYTSHGLN